MAFEFSPSKVDSITVVNLKGTIVTGGDKEMFLSKLQELLQAGERNFILDFAQVTYVDSTGIGTLIEAHSLAERKGGCVRLLHLTKRIHDVLQITRLSSVFGIYDDLQKAVKSFKDEGGG
jgi:anti-sigma B factor antagonist